MQDSNYMTLQNDDWEDYKKWKIIILKNKYKYDESDKN